MEGTCVYLPIVIILMQCGPCAPVTVSSNAHRVTVEEFSDAVLSCLFHTEKDQHPRIEWKKKGRDVSFVYYDGHFRGPFEGRAKIDGATVTLQKVRQADAGEYRCEISAPFDSVSLGETNVTLVVFVPPQTPTCEIPSSAVTGSSVHLRCRDQQSIPPAKYSWYKDGQPIRPQHHTNATYVIDLDTGVMEFKSVSKEDTGRYSCLASNGIGSPKMCEGKQMTIEDVNVTVVVAAVVVVCLLVVICSCGGLVLHRNGFFTRHRGRSFWIPQCHGAAHISSQTLHRADDTSNVNYVPPPQEPQDFKHTQSFML